MLRQRKVGREKHQHHKDFQKTVLGNLVGLSQCCNVSFVENDVFGTLKPNIQKMSRVEWGHVRYFEGAFWLVQAAHMRNIQFRFLGRAIRSW